MYIKASFNAVSVTNGKSLSNGDYKELVEQTRRWQNKSFLKEKKKKMFSNSNENYGSVYTKWFKYW